MRELKFNAYVMQSGLEFCILTEYTEWPKPTTQVAINIKPPISYTAYHMWGQKEKSAGDGPIVPQTVGRKTQNRWSIHHWANTHQIHTLTTPTDASVHRDSTLKHTYTIHKYVHSF